MGKRQLNVDAARRALAPTRGHDGSGEGSKGLGVGAADVFQALNAQRRPPEGCPLNRWRRTDTHSPASFRNTNTPVSAAPEQAQRRQVPRPAVATGTTATGASKIARSALESAPPGGSVKASRMCAIGAG